MRYIVDGALACENTRIRVRLFESPRDQPREQGALPTATGLSHAIYGLDDAVDAGLAVRSGCLVAWRWVTIYDFARFKFALEIGRDEIPSAHREATYLCAALNTEPSLECAVALSLVHPHQSDQCPFGRYVFAVDEFQAPVVRVVGDFGALSGCPAGTVVA
eukprot:6181630-Pleurochrysis_carterae.AAC.2